MTRLDLDQYVNQKEPLLALLSDRDARRDTNWKIVISKYERSLIEGDNNFVKLSSMSEVTAPTTGTAKINTTVGDAYLVDLLAAASAIAGDMIWVYNGTTTKYEEVPRVKIEDIIVGGTGETVVGFFEINGKFALYIKESTFTTIPADLHYNYWRKLSYALAADGTVLDILEKDFTTLADELAELMLVGTD